MLLSANPVYISMEVFGLLMREVVDRMGKLGVIVLLFYVFVPISIGSELANTSSIRILIVK